jgi:hypothetical protein
MACALAAAVMARRFRRRINARNQRLLCVPLSQQRARESREPQAPGKSGRTQCGVWIQVCQRGIEYVPVSVVSVPTHTRLVGER